jgi:hypothetical protein
VKAILLLCSCLALPGCRTAGPLERPIKLQHLPPTAKDVIDVAMQSSRIPLTDPTCVGYGTEPTDKTIGRYLAGYLAELSNQDARNAVTTSIQPGTENGQPVYVCRLMIRHAQGEDVWSWGVQFTARQSDGLVLTKSLQCLGAG